MKAWKCFCHDFDEDTYKAKNGTWTNRLRLKARHHGCYVFFVGDRCLYVGKANGRSTMAQRVLQHIRHYDRTRGYEDFWLALVEGIEDENAEIIFYPHSDPDRLELDLMRHYQPTYNRTGCPRKEPYEIQEREDIILFSEETAS